MSRQMKSAHDPGNKRKSGNKTAWTPAMRDSDLERANLTRTNSSWELKKEEGDTEETLVTRLFNTLDVDDSGGLDFSEIKKLTKLVGERFSSAQLETEYEKMVSRQYRVMQNRLAQARMHNDREQEMLIAKEEASKKYAHIERHTFMNWWMHYQQARRRSARLVATSLFAKAALTLDESWTEEGLVKAVISHTLFMEIRTEFRERFDWFYTVIEEDKEPCLTGSVSWEAFGNWRAFVIEDDDFVEIPVVPEYMANKIASLNKHSEQTATKKHSRWLDLGPRLRTLVSLQKQWGVLHDLYKGAPDMGSFMVESPPGSCIKLPDSTFSVNWDMAQVVALIYVAIFVPFNTGFDVDEELLTTAWFVDVSVDLYFIMDLVLNFRTAFYYENGVLESSPSKIVRHYLKGWFMLDFVSCLPVQYVQLMFNSGGGDSEGPNTKTVKLIRLVRLTKLLRLAKIKRLILQYDALMDFSWLIGLLISLASIVFTTHMLACGWSMVGDFDAMSPDGTIVYGWKRNYDTGLNWGRGTSTQVTAVTRDMKGGSAGYGPSNGMQYIVSMNSVFLGSWAFTGPEYTFSMIAQLVVAFIYGGLAGLMSTLMAHFSQGEEEYNTKLSALKAWMKARDVNLRDRDRIMSSFNSRHKDAVCFDQAEIMNELPKPLASDISFVLYGRYIAGIPIFKSLGKELHSHISNVVNQELFAKNQTIFEEGSVGTEFYFIMGGEVEVESRGRQLGFLGQNAFFGERPFLESMQGNSGENHEIRTRTVQATIETEVGYLMLEDMEQIIEHFPELRVRITLFVKAGLNRIKKGHQLAHAISEGLAAKKAKQFQFSVDDEIRKIRDEARQARQELREAKRNRAVSRRLSAAGGRVARRSGNMEAIREVTQRLEQSTAVIMASSDTELDMVLPATEMSAADKQRAETEFWLRTQEENLKQKAEAQRAQIMEKKNRRKR